MVETTKAETTNPDARPKREQNFLTVDQVEAKTKQISLKTDGDIDSFKGRIIRGHNCLISKPKLKIRQIDLH